MPNNFDDFMQSEKVPYYRDPTLGILIRDCRFQGFKIDTANANPLNSRNHDCTASFYISFITTNRPQTYLT